jgi:hypothetical protein
MKAETIREVALDIANKAASVKDDDELSAVNISIPVAHLMMVSEIAAHLAELNETLKAANQLQKDLFGFELKPKDEHGAPALNEFLSGLKPMGPDGEPRS